MAKSSKSSCGDFPTRSAAEQQVEGKMDAHYSDPATKDTPFAPLSEGGFEGRVDTRFQEMIEEYLDCKWGGSGSSRSSSSPPSSRGYVFDDD